MENKLKDASTSAKTLAAPNPPVLWRQLLGLVAWVGVVSFFVGGPVGLVLSLLLGGLTFADAWTSGIYKRRDRKSFSNNSPMGWGIAVALLLIIGYPTYIVNRNKLRTIEGTNFFYWAVIVLGGLVIAAFILGIVGRFAVPPK